MYYDHPGQTVYYLLSPQSYARAETDTHMQWANMFKKLIAVAISPHIVQTVFLTHAIQGASLQLPVCAVQGKGGQLDLQTALPRILNPGQGTGALWRPRYVSCFSCHPVVAPWFGP